MIKNLYECEIGGFILTNNINSRKQLDDFIMYGNDIVEVGTAYYYWKKLDLRRNIRTYVDFCYKFI